MAGAGGINLSMHANGANQALVAGIPGKKIRVLQLFLVFGSNGSLQFLDGNTPLTGPMQVIPNCDLILPPSSLGWFETGVGGTLSVSVGGTFADGALVYEVAYP